MIEKIRNLFFGKKLKELQRDNKQLAEALVDCSDKLQKKQEQINKTNAYYKRLLAEKNKKKTKL